MTKVLSKSDMHLSFSFQQAIQTLLFLTFRISYVVFTYVMLAENVMLLILSYIHIIASHNDFSYCMLLPLINIIMAVFSGLFFFALTKFAPKNCFTIVYFFKGKTPQLFIFAIVYKKNVYLVYVLVSNQVIKKRICSSIFVVAKMNEGY